MKELILSQGYVALVDDEDFERLNQYKWTASKCGNKVYAVRNQKVGKNKYKRILLHREIMGVSNKQRNICVDHINGDTMNYAKHNLRVCTRRENVLNQESNRGKSKYKGVSWCKQTNKWRAQIQYDGKHICCGRYTVEKDAAIAYNVKAKELFGDFAKLNEVI